MSIHYTTTYNSSHSTLSRILHGFAASDGGMMQNAARSLAGDCMGVIGGRGGGARTAAEAEV
jgi:hypothetical protein